MSPTSSSRRGCPSPLCSRDRTERDRLHGTAVRPRHRGSRPSGHHRLRRVGGCAHTVPPCRPSVNRLTRSALCAAPLLLAQIRGEPSRMLDRRRRCSLPRGSCGCPDGDGSTATEAASIWRARRRWFRTPITRWSLDARQYEISMQLLDHETADPEHLGGSPRTNAAVEPGPSGTEPRPVGGLRIVGAHDPPPPAGRLGTSMFRRGVPTASLMSLADPHANEVTIVVPVKARGLD